MLELDHEANSGAPDVGWMRRGLEAVGNHLTMAAVGGLGNLVATAALNLAAQLN